MRSNNQASINIRRKGLKTLGISPSKLLVVHQKVTAVPESTGAIRNNQKKSIALAVEPSNPHVQLNLFEWRNGRAIVC